MKNIWTSVFYILQIPLFSFNVIPGVYGQEKLNISAGLCLPELFNVSARKQFD